MHDVGSAASIMPKAGKITEVCAKDAFILSLLFAVEKTGQMNRRRLSRRRVNTRRPLLRPSNAGALRLSGEKTARFFTVRKASASGHFSTRKHYHPYIYDCIIAIRCRFCQGFCEKSAKKYNGNVISLSDRRTWTFYILNIRSARPARPFPLPRPAFRARKRKNAEPSEDSSAFSGIIYILPARSACVSRFAAA